MIPPTSTQRPVTGRTRDLVLALQALAVWITHHWLLILNGLVFLYLFGAVLAPTFLRAGLDGPANMLYTAYSFTCHQLPERSYFLYGPDGAITSYNLDDVLGFGADGRNQLTLRTFVGSPDAGYKVAVSDRMISMYAGTLIAGLLYGLLRRRWQVPILPLWALVILALPMMVDGVTHMVDDVTGVGPAATNWRNTNTWASPIFGNSVPPEFYTGTEFGSLNSLLRWITGLLFGFGTAWFAYPLIGLGFDDIADQAERQEARRKARETTLLDPQEAL